MTRRKHSSKQNAKRTTGSQKVSNDETIQNGSSVMQETSDVLKTTREAIFNQKVNSLADDGNMQNTTITQNTQSTQNTIPQQWGHRQGQFISPQPVVNGGQNMTNTMYPSSTPTENSYQSVQLNAIQQPVSYTDNGMPQWAANMCQQLNNIQCTLEQQNRRWQSMEEKLQTQNARMSNMESQLANLPVLEQSISQANRNIEHTQREVRSIKQKVTEYDNTIQHYSDVCDDMITSNTNIGKQVNDVHKK